jgi:pimeloyl-ACP methyl ester carboxylesterase
MNAAVVQPASADTPAIRPFRVNVPEADLIDLRRRINAARLPEKETVTDFSQGVPLATVQKLAKYWGTEYDWRRCEARLNAVPNFITEIDGLDIHFIHVRSKHDNALPLIVSHGWPGSIVEQLKLIEPLTNPTEHGGTAADAFHVVIPSMPGYGFSGKPTSPGWGPERIARAWDTLMKRLGYTRYAAQGGDWGAIVVELMGAQAPQGLLGIHTNMPNVVPAAIDTAAFAGAPLPAGLSPDEKHAYEMLVSFYKNVYYALFMGTRPQTLTALAGRACHFHARPRRAQPRADRPLVQRSRGRAHARRRPRQRHAVLADEHRCFRGAPVLGEQDRLLRAERREGSGGRQRLPGRSVLRAEELGGAGLSQAAALHPAAEGWPLRCLGAAEVHHGGAAPRLPVAAHLKA